MNNNLINGPKLPTTHGNDSLLIFDKPKLYQLKGQQAKDRISMQFPVLSGHTLFNYYTVLCGVAINPSDALPKYTW